MVDISQAHARLLRDETVQFRFPSASPPAKPPAPPNLPPIHIGDWLFWVVIAIVGVMLSAVLVQAVRNRGLPSLRKAGTIAPGDPEAAHQPLAVPASALADADALAWSGEYGAAVHALLLRGIGALQQRYPRTLEPAHTSRDIASLGALPPALRSAFATIAERTERAVFARRALGREDWEACRATYARLLDPAAQVQS